MNNNGTVNSISRYNVLINKAHKNSQLFLSLCDKTSFTKYKEEYITLVNEFFLEISLNIDKQEYFDEFIKHSDAWINVIDSDSRKIHIEIILKQKDKIKDFSSLVAIFKESYFDIDSMDSLLLQRDTLELKNLIFEAIQVSKSWRLSRELAEIGSTTDDIDIALSILEKLESEDRHSILRVQKNIARIKANTDIENSLAYVTSEFNKKDIETAKYDLAIQIYSQDSDKSENIIKSLGTAYIYGFQAFEASRYYNKNRIYELIDDVHTNKVPDLDGITIKNIAYSVLDNYPLIADYIIQNLDINWGWLLEVQVHIVVALSQRDINEALEYLKIIDVEDYQAEAITELIELHSEESDLKKFFDIACDFSEATLKYWIFYSLHKKIKIPFSILEEAAKELKPYDNVLF